DGAQHVAGAIERNEAVLLSGYRDRRYARTDDRIQRPRAVSQRLDPPLGELLARAIIPGDQVERRRHRLNDDPSLGVICDDLDALRPNIDPEKYRHAASLTRRAASTPAARARSVNDFKYRAILATAGTTHGYRYRAWRYPPETKKDHIFTQLAQAP